MAIAHIGRSEVFVASVDSPSAEDALLNLGPPIILQSERFGSVALGCIKTNRLNPDSAVVLDDTVEPPVLELREAIAVIIPVSFNEDTGDPVIDYCDRSLGQRVVSGIYAGPGSELSVL